MITSGAADDNLNKRAMQIAKKLTSKSKIEFTHMVNPDLIGGFVLRVGDVQYDASLKRKLARMKKHLLDS